MTAEPIDDDRELAQFRQQYYGLLVNLLSREPTAEVLAALGAGISERAEAARALHPLLGEGWDRLAKLLPALTAASAEEEFLALFIGPFQPAVNAYESWYLTGQLFQAPLIAVRRFLAQVGLERKEAEYPEPEDALAFELEVMNWMLTRQLAAASAEEGREWLHRQSAFLKDHLLIWAPKFTEDLETAEKARLYGGVALLLRGLLSMERQRLQGMGVPSIETLDQARRRYGSPRGFRGPLFDPGSSNAPPAPNAGKPSK
jgi:TorA maturation chaperone TorD